MSVAGVFSVKHVIPQVNGITLEHPPPSPKPNRSDSTVLVPHRCCIRRGREPIWRIYRFGIAGRQGDSVARRSIRTRAHF